MHASRLPIVGILMLIGAALVSTQNAPAPQGGAPPPQGGAPIFRTGVNLVRVDVIVADNDGNPVTDVKKEEFEIVEDGRPQTIDLFRHIRIDSTVPTAPHARQVLNRDTEEREAARDDVRVFGILLADYQVCGQRSRAVRDAMAAFIRKLGPNDLIAVMQPLM
jgi:VWFA-related protein